MKDKIGDPAPFAFYAPMKAPTHPRPSGDRAIGRALLQLFGRHAALVSTFRSYEKHGDQAVQTALFNQASQEIDRLACKGKAENWQAWITYHNYYKAPDLLGVAVSKALNIPYIIFEASRSPKRHQGPWSRFAQAADLASDAADIIFSPTQRNMPALIAAQPAHQQLEVLPPFLPRSTLPEPAKVKDSALVNLLCVAMMRTGDKLASYQTLAQALQAVTAVKREWQLKIVGDGEAAQQVHQLFAPFGNKISYLGKLSADMMGAAYQDSDVFIWPGVGEAFGMVYLEAQAYGLPVLAENRVGLRDICRDGALLSPADQPKALAENIVNLIESSDLRYRIGQAGRAQIQAEHLYAVAHERIWKALHRLPKLANFSVH